MFRPDEDNLIIEFETLPLDEHVQKLRKTIQQLRDERWAESRKANDYRCGFTCGYLQFGLSCHSLTSSVDRVKIESRLCDPVVTGLP